MLTPLGRTNFKTRKGWMQYVRCAVPDMEAAEAIKEIVKRINIPLVADIHFDYRLAFKNLLKME